MQNAPIKFTAEGTKTYAYNWPQSEGNVIIVLVINSLINPRKENIFFFTVYMQAQIQV